jgi:signal transduction histidine kinase
MRPEDFRPDDLFGQIQSLVDALGEERRARESAEAANHAKAELLAMIGEELRPPLETIAGMCELLLSSSLDQTQAHYAETLYQSARSLLSVLGDVLDFSRLESGRLALGQDPFDLHELVENIGSVLQSRANAQGLTGSVDLSANCPCILVGDAARLRQVVMSLIENALKYIAIGSIRLHVSATEANGRPVLRFDLIDTGVGLSRAVQERLFQPSGEIDSKLGGKSSPTGLALPIASKLARQMGRELGCVVGQGTHYWFTFPAERARPLASSPRRGNDASQSGLSGHVLVIENNAVNRMLIGSYLAEFGLPTTSSTMGKRPSSASQQGHTTSC